MNLKVNDDWLNDPKVELEIETTSLVASLHATQVNISNANTKAIFAPSSYHMSPTPQCLNVEGAINCVVSDWTPKKNINLGNLTLFIMHFY